MALFALVPLAVCIYEIFSLIVPLKLPAWVKILLSLVLLSGLAKNFVYRRTADGFELAELHYTMTLALSVIFNFVVAVVFMLLVKDIILLFWKILIRSPFPSAQASTIVFAIGIIATVYGTYEGLRVPDVKRYDVNIKGLGRELDGMKIALMVDIHADILTDRNFVRVITDKTNALEPDVILLPGDFVDGTVKARYSDVEPLKDLRAKYGVYGTTGNHEYYYDYNRWMVQLEEFGIHIMQNESVLITSGDSRIAIAGLPDPTGGQMGRTGRDIAATLKGIPEGVPVVLMDHQPRFAPENAGHNVALQVSGHTHGGQIPGIYWLVKRFNNGFVRGWYDLGSMSLYVSPGTSQWNGLPMRIFDPAEITLFTLHAEEGGN